MSSASKEKKKLNVSVLLGSLQFSLNDVARRITLYRDLLNEWFLQLHVCLVWYVLKAASHSIAHVVHRKAFEFLALVCILSSVEYVLLLRGKWTSCGLKLAGPLRFKVVYFQSPDIADTRLKIV
jgi:hypothetical protein